MLSSKHRHAKHSEPAYGTRARADGAHLLGAGLCLAAGQDTAYVMLCWSDENHSSSLVKV